MVMFVVALALFLLLHSIRIFAPAWRKSMIDKMGVRAWRGVYSVLSIVTFIFLIYAFAQSRAVTPMLYYPPVWLAHIAFLLMLISFILAAVSIFPAGKLAVWTKHPLLAAVKFWALAHLLANGELNSVILFAGFLIWAVAARISAKRQNIQPRAFKSVQWDIIAVITGIVLYGLFIMYLHELLIGVSPLAMIRS
ncbi:NnrU family protein [Rhizobium sp. L1K21]|uniref:NnrU family protein n=1 Tax=Rhizobium sp. L1K21 TaxID=2954933 RepID=UPI0020929E45|nr:NnrU family protein [Rhizobium sp. L1K21]MCO6185138.1 NnrU family protein [Rhizobium sp. L1K21]